MSRNETHERGGAERREAERRGDDRRNEDRRGAQVAFEDVRGDGPVGRDDARGAGADEDAFEDLPEGTHGDDIRQLTRDQLVRELSLREIETLTGMPSPSDPSPEEEREYRLMAWESVKIDVGSADEWGGVNPDSDPETTPEDQHDRPPGWGRRDG